MMDQKHLTAYCDGAAEPTNPGPIGAGYVLTDAEGNQIEAKGFYLGRGTNNIAEYTALIKATEAALRWQATSLDLRTDAQLLIKQVHGLWAVNKEHLRELRDQALALLSRIPHWTLEWIPGERNRQADSCSVHAALLKRDVDYSDQEIPLNDFRRRQKNRPAVLIPTPDRI